MPSCFELRGTKLQALGLFDRRLELIDVVGTDGVLQASQCALKSHDTCEKEKELLVHHRAVTCSFGTRSRASLSSGGAKELSISALLMALVS